MKHRVCIILCLLAMLGFAVVFVQAQWNPFKMKPLNGFTPAVEKPELTLDNFASGNYQEQMEQYIGEHLGFREFFIRCYNQTVYSCFDNITNNNIVEGLNQELFLKMYLDEVSGKTLRTTFASVEEAKATAQNNVEETLRLVDTLRQHGTEFLFIFAPSKTRVYPEWLPKQYQNNIPDFSLQEYYIELFKEHGIPHIDFLNGFRSVKDTVEYPLYTKTGTHWAASTIPWVADSILRKMEELTCFNLPSDQRIHTVVSTDYYVMDRELEEDMNLLFPLSKPALPNPTFFYADTVGKDRPNLLVVGDSYSNQLVHSGFGKVFNHWDLWLYNKDIYSSRPSYNWMVLNRELDAVEMVNEADVVLAVFTAPMCYNYMFGFPKTIQNIYRTGFVDDDEALLAIIDMIHRDSTWYSGVVEQAEQRNITIEESILGNAQYYLEFKRQINLQKTQQP